MKNLRYWLVLSLILSVSLAHAAAPSAAADEGIAAARQAQAMMDKQPLLVVYSTPGCGPCRQMLTALRKAGLRALHVEDAPAAITREITSYPHTVLACEVQGKIFGSSWRGFSPQNRDEIIAQYHEMEAELRGQKPPTALDAKNTIR